MHNKLFALCIAAILVCNMTWGCKQTTNNDSNVSSEDTVDLSWYINFSWFTTKWGGNLVSDTISDKLGVDIDFVVPAGDSSNKLNSMIEADSLPDLITLGWWEAKISEMIENDMVYALDELANEYEPYFWRVTDKQTLQWYTSDDGHIYQYPNSSFSPSDYEEYDTLASNVTFLVRKDMYEAIGSPDMTTPEGFANAVRKAAKMFPIIDGNEMIPVGSHEFGETGCDSFDGFLLDFLAVPYMENGRAIDRIKNPDYIAWLKAFRSLGAEGLLKDDIFIDTRTQMEEKISKGQYFCMIYQRTDIENGQKILYKNNPDSVYIAVDGPKNSNGDDYRLPGTSINGWTVTLISKNCKNPQKAIELISYLISEEGQLMTWLGVEGITWDYDSNGIPRMKSDIKKLLDNDRTKFDKIYGADSCYWMFQNDAMASRWVEDNPQSPMTQLKEWTYPYTVYVGQYTITFNSGTEIYDIKRKADTEWGDVLPKLLLSKTEDEFDEIYNKYIDSRYSIGYEKVLDALTIEMNKNIEKLGLTNEK